MNNDWTKSNQLSLSLKETRIFVQEDKKIIQDDVGGDTCHSVKSSKLCTYKDKVCKHLYKNQIQATV
jgi:hypothetical protein